MPVHTQTSTLPYPPEVVFDWHGRPGAFTRLTPPWEDVQLVAHEGGLEEGARMEMSAPLVGPLRTAYVARHTWCERPIGFTDVQESGPFESWVHEHRFEATGEGTKMIDRIEWTAPLGPAGRIADPLIIRPRLERMFAWRHARLARDLRRHHEAGLAPMRIAITGASGLVGRTLTAFLTTGGHTVVPLTRKKGGDGIWWDPQGGEVGPGLEDCDAVIHLAGAGIAEHEWSDDYKATIRDSRTNGTRTLCEALAKLPPKVLVSTSAIGIYGDRKDEPLDELSPVGTGFLAEVGEAWEDATSPAREAGWRVAIVRVGLVLSAHGGLLGPLLPLFRRGGGGPVGSGQQWMSWIHVDDLVALYHFLLAREVDGVFNGVAPNPVRNADFGKALGRAVGRPAIVPAPAFGVRMVLGREKADELLLASQRVAPRRALEAGFRFDEAELDGALGFELVGAHD
ncbi:MAG: TIGR01777 family protein [Alphaproteobacteria bacterium]|nr:TIGR01777 family protein [Alphaproteobacteria bacterium]